MDYKIFEAGGNKENIDSLECPDIVNWFISTMTTLSSTTGHGYAKVSNIASLKSDLQISNIPSAPAVFSVAGESYGPGISIGGLSSKDYGHTGIVLSAQKQDNGKYLITYIHTYNDLLDSEEKCSITTREFDISDNVTYVNVGKYMK